MRLAVVTATIDPGRARPCLESWGKQAAHPFDLYMVVQGIAAKDLPWDTLPAGYQAQSLHYLHRQEILGVVPAFALGVAKALEDGAEVIACLHDDVEIEQGHWDQEVLARFRDRPEAGLQGFGGGVGLGDGDIYQTPYNPMQLARQGFISNMRHAEAHGARTTQVQPVACLDGFSQIGRAAYWMGLPPRVETINQDLDRQDRPNLFQRMARLGIIHHAYDAALGCYAKRLGWEVLLNPIACHHHGGLTAVADTRYHTWAGGNFHAWDHKGNAVSGDAALWVEAHRIVYEEFRDVLPIRV